MSKIIEDSDKNGDQFPIETNQVGYTKEQIEHFKKEIQNRKIRYHKCIEILQGNKDVN